jgi:hypothetical protein
VDTNLNEIEYIEKVITTVQGKYSLDNNKVSTQGPQACIAADTAGECSSAE